jgi:hypothetical protein
MRLMLLAVLLLAGCGGIARVSETAPTTGSFASSWNAEKCQRLLDKRDAAFWGGVMGNGLGGVGSLVMAFPDVSDKVKLGVGIGALAVAAASTSLMFLGRTLATEFEIYCNQVGAGSPVMTPMMPVPDLGIEPAEPGEIIVDDPPVAADGGVEGP